MERYYYTLQSVAGWEFFKENKVIECKPEYEQFPKLYSLMKKEMECRLTDYKSEHGIIWLIPYYVDRAKHSCRYTQQIVQLKIALDEDEVLDSYFYLWHRFVMAYIRNKTIPDYNSFLEVFDVENLKLESLRNIQCTTGKIDIDRVVSAEYLN